MKLHFSNFHPIVPFIRRSDLPLRAASVALNAGVSLASVARWDDGQLRYYCSGF